MVNESTIFAIIEFVEPQLPGTSFAFKVLINTVSTVFTYTHTSPRSQSFGLK